MTPGLKLLPLVAVSLAGCALLKSPSPQLSSARSHAQNPSLEQHFSDLRARALALVQQGRLLEARELFQRGEEQAQQAREPRWAIRFRVGAANTELYLHRYREAIQQYLALLPAAEQARDPELLLAVYTNIAAVYLALGDAREATVWNQRAWRAVERAGSASWRCALLAQQARIRSLAGDDQGTSALLYEAVRLAARTSDAPLHARLAQEYGYQLLSQGKLGEAEDWLVDAYRLYRLAAPPVPPGCYRDLAWLYCRQGELALARRLIDRAFQTSGETPRIPIWSLYYRRGLIRWAQSDLEGARIDLAKAREAVERARLHLLPIDWVAAQAGGRVYEVYRDSVRLAAEIYSRTGKLRYAWEAFQAADAGTAFALKQTLLETGPFGVQLPGRYWEDLAKLSQAEAELIAKPSPEAHRKLAELDRRLTAAELEAGLRWSPLGGGLRWDDLDQLRARLGPDELLLVWWVDEPLSYLWLASRHEFELVRIPGRKELARLIDSYRTQLEQGNEDYNTGERLLAALLGEGRREASRYPHWLLVLSDPLFGCPFPALVEADGEPRYLVERHTLRVLPASAFLRLSRDGAWRGPAVLVADPIYNRADPRYPAEGWASRDSLLSLWHRQRPQGPFELARLAGSSMEANEVQRLLCWDGHRPRLLTGTSATFETLQRSLELQPALIHLATHVVPSPAGTGEPALVFSMQAGGHPEIVTSRAVSALRIQSRLVVMAGCSSGTGTMLPAEGLWGLTRAWLRAGARMVIGALWPAADSMRPFWGHFYGHLPADPAQWTGATVARALQAAQVSFLQAGGWRRKPLYWAPYFVYGLN